MIIHNKLFNNVRLITACTLGIVLLVGCNKNPSQTAKTLNQGSNTSVKTSALIGTWRVFSAKEYEPGKKEGKDFYGLKPRGRLIFDENGNYMLTVMRNDLPEFKTTDDKPLGREDGTDEMNKSVVRGSIANFGKYEDNNSTLTLLIEKATYPNWDERCDKNGENCKPFKQNRPYRISGDTLIYTVPEASSGGGRTAEFKWIRKN